jgi:glycosyltransferase involved in cell wall biosynthesis
MAHIGIDIRKLADFGIGTYIRNLLLQLERNDSGHQYTLFHFPGADLDGLPVGMKRTVEKAGLYSLREPFTLGRNARRAKLDLLHCPHYVTPFAPGCQLAVTIHDLIHLLFPEQLPNRAAYLYARFFLKRAAKKAKVIFVDSECTRKDVLAHLPAREERIIVAHLAVDPSINRSVGEAERNETRRRFKLDRPFVLYVGNLKPHKNLETGVDAFARFRSSAGNEWEFVIAGRDRADEALRRRIESLALGEVVRFVGFVSAQALPALYSAASLFFLPSLYEGFGLPPLEAMAVGTPVVVSNRGALPEVLGDAALLVDPEDVEALAAALERAAGDDALRSALVEKGRRRVREFSWEKLAEKTLAGYRLALEAE